jgi:hypothetical protein
MKIESLMFDFHGSRRAGLDGIGDAKRPGAAANGGICERSRFAWHLADAGS